MTDEELERQVVLPVRRCVRLQRTGSAVATLALCALAGGCDSGAAGRSIVQGAPDAPFKDSPLAPRAQLSICALYGLGGGFGAAVSADGRMVAVGGEDVVALVDAQTGTELRHVVSPNHASVLAFSPDASLLAIVGEMYLHVHRTSDGTLALSLPIQISNVAFSPDGSLVLTYGAGLCAYRVADGSQVWMNPGAFFGGIASDGSEHPACRLLAGRKAHLRGGRRAPERLLASRHGAGAPDGWGREWARLARCLARRSSRGGGGEPRRHSRVEGR